MTLLTFENSADGLRDAIDDRDGALIAHARWADDADRSPLRSPSWNVEATRLNGAQVGRRMLRPDDDGQARRFDRSRQQLDQLMLLFDHPEQHAERLDHVAGDRRRRASPSMRNDAPWTWSVSSGSTSLEARLRQLERALHQRVVEQSLLAQPLDDGLARFVQRQAGELAVDVVGGLRERGRAVAARPSR